jgi:predicted transposase YbfD/YdcC
VAQTVEHNRGRPEARALVPFEVSAEGVCFPGAAQGARLTRFVDRRDANNEGVETEWLISSRSRESLTAAAMLAADRGYWGIENGLHLRLDVTAGEDRSRVRQPVNALNLGMIRRATMSLAIAWIARCRNKRQATLRGFYDAMAAGNARKALSLVTVSKPSWLPR